MQIKLLKEVVGSIAGVGATGLVDLLYGKKNVNEFLIAKKLGLNINQTRNILYKLTDEGLVSFIRKKDKKNGGWYTYYWTLDATKSLANLKSALINEIKQFESQLQSRKSKRFYHCSRCDLEMSEENALLNNFTCPECGEVLALRDNTEFIKRIETSIEKRREQLNFVERELAERHQKEETVRGRKIWAEAKKKIRERMLKKKAREAIMRRAKKVKSRKPLAHRIRKKKKAKSRKKR